MRSQITRIASLGLVTAALAACSSDSAVNPGSGNSSADVAALVASTSAARFNSGPRSLVALPATNTAPAIDPSLCPFSTSNQDFECAPITRDGLTFKTSYFLLDASGHSLTQPTVSALAAIRAIIDVTGTTVLPSTNSVGTSVTIGSHSDNTLSGLLTNDRMLNGTGHEHDSLSTGIGGATTHSVLDATTTTANLQIPQSTGAWPASGTITSDVNTVTSAGSLPSITTTARIVTTFNGTSTVTTQLTIGGHTSTCKVDLSLATGPICT